MRRAWLAACAPLLAGTVLAAPTLPDDPASCGRCHPGHYREWAGSMHAYAVKDPVFRAMNRLGQDATGGKLGDFCVACHAPLAVRRGLTRDGLNLDQVPETLHGVTCQFCHTVEAVEGGHNHPLRLAGDGAVRGGIADPVANAVHASRYSALHDHARPESAALCGSCHDIDTPPPTPVALERTFREWRTSVYARPRDRGGLTCGGCHMPGRDGPAADVPDAPPRRVHSHRWPGVDVALEDFPDKEAQRAAIQRLLDSAVAGRLCVGMGKRGVELRVTLENLAAGHAFPSGAAQDRRLWVEVSARRGGKQVFASGLEGPEPPAQGAGDPRPWVFRDILRDVHGAETHRFWEAARIESKLLPVPVADAQGRAAHHVSRTYRYPDRRLPDTVEVAVRLRPIGRDVLDELVRLGYLEAEDREQVPTFGLGGARLSWRAAAGRTCVEPAARR
ncbi:multiheme c-type cytochrome [Methylomagnum ishizawai]|uniref:multiheme c-type cytochrome n=1 Tax=Methylomagnum ishizawai TaxID=1760988 RepID=UPI001C33A6CD|nr:multiheme c-type cytochrome [Methylomagnum ishizawai]BBL76882.1 hypothetical protein MishRS11D_39800 [Methylomagnum ishizawai]